MTGSGALLAAAGTAMTTGAAAGLALAAAAVALGLVRRRAGQEGSASPAGSAVSPPSGRVPQA